MSCEVKVKNTVTGKILKTLYVKDLAAMDVRKTQSVQFVFTNFSQFNQKVLARLNYRKGSYSLPKHADEVINDEENFSHYMSMYLEEDKKMLIEFRPVYES